MAGDWIKWVKGLAKRPEVLHMAHMLGKPRHEVAGLIMEFWEWADDNVDAPDASGKCPGFVRIKSASVALVDAIAGADGFANALSTVGWIVIRDGALEFPKFGRHNGKSAKNRALDADRKRVERKTRPESVREMSGSEPDKKRTREEKSREELKTPKAPTGGGSRASPPKPLVPLEAMQIVADAWNLIPGLTPVLEGGLTEKRRKHLRSRLGDPLWAERWREALQRIPRSDWLMGKNDRGWIANFDWFVQPDTVIKLLEGQHDGRAPTTGKPTGGTYEDSLGNLAKWVQQEDGPG